MRRSRWSLHRAFGAPLSRRPFADNPKAAAEARGAKPAPEFCGIATPGCPIFLQPRQPEGQAVLAHPEDIVALSTHDPADEAAAQSCCPHNALDRNTFAGHAPDGLVCMLSALEAVVLQALGCGE